jgi:hypothetical protein
MFFLFCFQHDSRRTRGFKWLHHLYTLLLVMENFAAGAPFPKIVGHHTLPMG